MGQPYIGMQYPTASKFKRKVKQMPDYNKVIMIGRLTRDPELSYTPNQTPVIDFAMATNHRWTGQDGSAREEVCFFDCRAFGKRAEILNQYISKGRALFIEGRLSFEQWEAQDGSKRNKHRVIIRNFQFLGGDRNSTSSEKNAHPAGGGTRETVSNGDNEDIPF